MSARRVTVGDLEIAYEERGVGSRPLVLVHGYTGTRKDFATQWDALAAEGRVLAPDLPGHGESSRPDDPTRYALEALSEDLARWMQELGLGPVDLLGHSMGGMLALRLTLAHPERVASLILMDTAAGPLAGVDRALFDKAVGLARAAGMAGLARAMRARAPDDSTRSEADRRVERDWGPERFWAWRDERLEAMDPEAYAALGPAMFDARSLVPELGRITCATLVMVGQEDRDFLEPAAELAREIPGARLVELAGAAHQPQHEAPQAWLAAVREHLARARGAAPKA